MHRLWSLLPWWINLVWVYLDDGSFTHKLRNLPDFFRFRRLILMCLVSVTTTILVMDILNLFRINIEVGCWAYLTLLTNYFHFVIQMWLREWKLLWVFDPLSYNPLTLILGWRTKLIIFLQCLQSICFCLLYQNLFVYRQNLLLGRIEIEFS